MSDDDLELRVAWQQHLGRSDGASQWFDTVIARYRAGDRHYHDIRHVCWVVRHATTLARCADDLGSVIAAAFFHDVVYDVTRTDNEAASARLADRALTELDWAVGRRRHVTAMIAATADHDAALADRDTRVLLAADLGVLAAEPARYGAYVRAVRREWAHVSDDAWATGRAAVLTRLLDRAHLYAPSLELDEWEQRARANIAAELATLGS